MSGLKINSNVESMRAQRRLSGSTQQLRDSFERLSSGLRINRAKDDASGLAIASNLQIDSRVLAQGVRNFNEAISLLNIAESSTNELTGILVRQRELAIQASNGTLSRTQRLALHEEANALVDEYNRITSSTTYNGQALLDGSFGTLVAQGDYGANGKITIALGEEIAATVGDGTFQSASNISVGSGPRGVGVGDFNNDGILDVATSDNGSNRVSVALGNGNGTFKARVSYAANTAPMYMAVADVSGDGIEDIVTANYGTDDVSVLISIGDGTFMPRVNYAVGDNPYAVSLADLNGDSVLDMVTADSGQGGGGDTVTVRLGVGNGTFNAARSYAAGDAINDVAVGDFNGDGKEDLITVVAAGANDSVVILFGCGNGSFSAPLTSTEDFINPQQVDVGDFNDDGNLDMIMNGGSSAYVRLGNGNGTFKAGTSFSPGYSVHDVFVSDLNEDGNDDFVVNGSGSGWMSVYLGAGSGTFQLSRSYSTSGSMRQISEGDLNGDGGTDLVVAGYGSNAFTFMIANTRQSYTFAELDLTTRSAALESLADIDDALLRVSRELGNIGASQNRMASAVNAILIRHENYVVAFTQIRDVDVAAEAAELTRSQILQQAGVAILAQANQAPELALSLLKSA